MKVGINSQTIRIDDGDITDYHVTDGMSSSHLMSMMTLNAAEYVKTVLNKYTERWTVRSIDDPLCWGSETDKFVDINYVDVDKVVVDSEMATKANRYFGSTFAHASPRTMNRPYKPTPPPKPRKSNSDIANETNFRKLFTGE
jgi:hypothetical protein